MQTNTRLRIVIPLKRFSLLFIFSSSQREPPLRFRLRVNPRVSVFPSRQSPRILQGLIGPSYLNKSEHEQAASKDRETVAERSCWLPRGKLARAAWLPPLHLDPPGRCCPVKDVLRSLLIPCNLYRSTITSVVLHLMRYSFVAAHPAHRS